MSKGGIEWLNQVTFSCISIERQYIIPEINNPRFSSVRILLKDMEVNNQKNPV